MNREDIERALGACETCGGFLEPLRAVDVTVLNGDREIRRAGFLLGFEPGAYQARLIVVAECSAGHAFRVRGTVGHDGAIRFGHGSPLRKLPPVPGAEVAELVEAVLDGWDLLVWNGDTEQPDEEAARLRIEAAVELVRALHPVRPRFGTGRVAPGVEIKAGQMVGLDGAGNMVPSAVRHSIATAVDDLPGGSIVEIDATRGRAKLAKDLADFYRPMAEDAIGAPETIPAETVVTQEMLKDFALRKLAEAGFVVPKELPVGVEVQSDRDPGQPLDRLPVCECGGELWVFDGPRAPLPDDQVYCRCKSCGREVRVRVHQEFKP